MNKKGNFRLCPELGDKLRFVPSAFVDFKEKGKNTFSDLARDVLGQVVFINSRHRFFDVLYKVNGHQLRESFKF